MGPGRGGADPLVRSRPPGRLVEGGNHMILREKSVRSGRADQGFHPTIRAGFRAEWHYARVPAPQRRLLTSNSCAMTELEAAEKTGRAPVRRPS